MIYKFSSVIYRYDIYNTKTLGKKPNTFLLANDFKI